jgi:murein L,D-transpeptidase YafK
MSELRQEGEVERLGGREWKWAGWLVLLCGLVGAGAWFLPVLRMKAESARRTVAGGDRAAKAAERVRPALEKDLAAKGLHFGDPVFIRIFKDERELELWVRDRDGGRFKHFRTWPVVAMSGELGPKLAEGDRQAPEGFYFVTPGRMNPKSRFHLSFNIGYPNAYDRAHGRTGSAIMVHGNRVSIGCFAMTDAKIEEIYTLCDAALKGGQPYFRVHVFPFRMTVERMARTPGEKWREFWLNLKEGYDWFEKKRTPPDVSVEKLRYTFRDS